MTELALIAALGLVGLLAAGILVRWVLAHDEGSAALREAAGAVAVGGAALLARQTKGAATSSAGLGVVVFAAYALVRAGSGAGADRLIEGAWAALSFAIGVGASLAAGYAGMWVSLRAGSRLAVILAAERKPRVRPNDAEPHPLNAALQLALRSGTAMGVVTVSLSLLAMTALFAAHTFSVASSPGADAAARATALARLPFALAGFGFGASLVALFMQLGGGVFATAAETALATTQAETGLKNPAQVTWAVGRHTRGFSAPAADLLETAAAETVGALVLVEALRPLNAGHGDAAAAVTFGFFLFPLAARAFGIIAAVVGVISVTTDGREDPLQAVQRGLLVTALLACLGVGGAAYWLLGAYWPAFFCCGAVGIGGGLVLARIAVARGPARIVAARGLGGALEAAWRPVAVLVAVLVASFELGEHSGLAHAGAFGASVAATGMLAAGGYVMAVNAVASLTDGALGLLDLLPEAIPRNADRDRLEASAPAARALGRAYLAGSSALASFALVMAYGAETVTQHCAEIDVALTPSPSAAAAICPAATEALGSGLLGSPSILVGAVAGALVVVTFAALSGNAVSATAQRFVDEVRRQIASAPIGSDYEPSYRRCVDVLAKDALKRSTMHAAAAVALPVAIGVLFKEGLGNGTESVGALLVTGTAAALVLRIVVENVEPVRGMSLAISPPMKLLATVSLVLAPLFV